MKHIFKGKIEYYYPVKFDEKLIGYNVRKTEYKTFYEKAKMNYNLGEKSEIAINDELIMIEKVIQDIETGDIIYYTNKVLDEIINQ